MIRKAFNGIQQEVMTAVFIDEIACSVNGVTVEVGSCSCLHNLTVAVHELKVEEEVRSAA